MTLNDLATLVCTKVNQNEPEDLAACKLFAGKRYEMIWNDQLWKDSIIDWTYTLPAAGTTYTVNSIWLPTRQHLILPATFDKVLAVRTDTRKLNIQSAEVYYRADYDVFQNQGMMVEYLVLPPAVWEFDLVQAVQLQIAAGDNGKAANVDMLEADGSTVARTALALVGTPPGVNFFDRGFRADAITKIATLSAVSVNAGPLLTNSATLPHLFTFYDVNNNVLLTITLQVGGFVQVPANSTQYSYDATAKTALPTAAQQGGNITATSGGFLGPGQEILNFGISVNGTLIYTLQPGDLAAVRRQRIALIGSIDVPAPTIRVLGKSKPNTFTGDNDSTALSGVDNCLLAIVEYDMLKRERQYAKAQSVLAEFQLLLDQLKQQEVVQTAHQKQIKPEDGYGNPYDLWAHPPLTF